MCTKTGIRVASVAVALVAKVAGSWDFVSSPGETCHSVLPWLEGSVPDFTLVGDLGSCRLQHAEGPKQSTKHPGTPPGILKTERLPSLIISKVPGSSIACKCLDSLSKETTCNG